MQTELISVDSKSRVFAGERSIIIEHPKGIVLFKMRNRNIQTKITKYRYSFTPIFSHYEIIPILIRLEKNCSDIKFKEGTEKGKLGAIETGDVNCILKFDSNPFYDSKQLIAVI